MRFYINLFNISETAFFKKQFICRKTFCRKSLFLSFIKKYDNLSNSCEKNIKIYRQVLMKSVLILVFPLKERDFDKACRIRTWDPWIIKPVSYPSATSDDTERRW